MLFLDFDKFSRQLMRWTVIKVEYSAIIAHRLNTSQNVDEIFFVNAVEAIRAGSFDHAVNMLLHGERRS